MKTAFRRLASGGSSGSGGSSVSSETDSQDSGLGRSPRLFSTPRSKRNDFLDDEGQVHVPMDFRGSCGKLVSCADLKEERDSKFLRGSSRRSHSGYRECKQEFPLQIPWFHNELSREEAGGALLKYGQVDGSFLVRPCGKLAGVCVLSYLHTNRVYHTKIHMYTEYDLKLFSLDDGKTKFMDLIQLIHFYQENKGSLMTKLTHYLERNQPVAAGNPNTQDNQQSAQLAAGATAAAAAGGGQHKHKTQQFLSPDISLKPNHNPEE